VNNHLQTNQPIMEIYKMARSKSAVLSPADKKAVVTDIKLRLKEAQNGLKASTGVLKLADRAYAGAIKLAEKEAKAFNTIITKLSGELTAVTNVA
jgi:hypothetical protein